MSIVNSNGSLSDKVDSVADFLTNKTIEFLGGLSENDRGHTEINTSIASDNQQDIVNDYFDKGGYTV